MTATSGPGIDAFVRELQRAVANDQSAIESVAGGPHWLSLRVGGRYVWIVTVQPLKRAWFAAERVPREVLRVLGWHERSPFAEHLRGARITDAQVLQTDQGRSDGLVVHVDHGGKSLRLYARFWPRPGALWLEAAEGERLAQVGRMEGSPLTPRPPVAEADHAANVHDARQELLAWAFETARQRLQQQTRNAVKRKRRLLDHLRKDLAQAQQAQDRRGDADLLAARMTDVPSGLAEITLEDFDGNARRIELDPSRTPAANLAAMYKRVAKAERKAQDLTHRVQEVQDQFERMQKNPARVQLAQDLDELAALAAELELSIHPPDKGEAAAKRRGEIERRPYKEFESGGFAIRVGRSAKDNDDLLRRFSKPKDLWLHASGVEEAT